MHVTFRVRKQKQGEKKVKKKTGKVHSENWTIRGKSIRKCQGHKGSQWSSNPAAVIGT